MMVETNTTSDKDRLISIKIRESTKKRLMNKCVNLFKDENKHDNRRITADFMLNRVISYYTGEKYR